MATADIYSEMRTQKSENILSITEILIMAFFCVKLCKHECNELFFFLSGWMKHANSINETTRHIYCSIRNWNSINIIYHFILWHSMVVSVCFFLLEWVFSTVRQFILRFMLSFSAVPQQFVPWICFYAQSSLWLTFEKEAVNRERKNDENGNWNWNFYTI